ncbi:MAG: TlyA family RNA methyltransferase [Ruminococcaceae bacterium]|nr:TlyA family RNA methyltransferase [Oscillospiraceae bacterium]
MMRADVFLCESGHVESRTRAARLIDEGKVIIDGKKISKASEHVDDGEHTVEITEVDRFVSRGGLKLCAALDTFEIDVVGKRCIDVGASTGGFTDCLLQYGAECVFAVDSGVDQLHYSLLENERVVSIEGFNARNLSRDFFGTFDIAVMDVSFISQTILHSCVADVLDEGAIFVSLIKPQFEAGRAALSKGGIVRDPKYREKAVSKVLDSARACGFDVVDVIRSPIEGGDGNREYLACFKRTASHDGSERSSAKSVDLKELCR